MNLFFPNLTLYIEDQRLAGLEADLTKRLSKDGREAINSLERLWKSKSRSFWDDVPEAIYGWFMLTASLTEASQLAEIKMQRAAIHRQLYPEVILQRIQASRTRLRRLPKPKQ